MELKPGKSANEQQETETLQTGDSMQAISRADRIAASGSAAPSLPIAADAEQIIPVDGRVQLPAGTRLDSIRQVGTDLVVTLPNGEVVLIVDGALRIPQFVIGTITIPQANIAALIAGQQPEPAAGALQSSGGNFSEAVGDIGDPFGLGDLLPATDFVLASDEDRELIPDALDNEPELLIATPDQPAGSASATATVAEAALPQRGSEPAGSDAASTAETVTGTILINSLDQPNAVTVNGTLVTAVGQTVATPFGVLTITSIAPDSIGYSYTLTDNSTTPETSDVVSIIVTDRDGDTASATLTLNIADDSPTARADIENVAPANYTSQTGNVLTGTGTASGSAGADTQGADGAAVSGIRAANGTVFTAPGTAIEGQYGRLLINADGSYSYTRNAGTPGGVADIFTYRLTDGDGDISTATLTFNIGDSGVGLIVPSAGDDGTLVDEAGLPERDNGDPGSRAGDDSNVTFGVVGFDVPDGPAKITINGVLVTEEGQEIVLANGSLFVFGIGPNGFEYAYILTDNSIGAASETITVTVADQDGDSVTSDFIIGITDDAPTAAADSDSIIAGTFGPATGNVITDAENDGGADTPGADGAQVSAYSGAGGSAAPGQPLAGLYGTLTLNADGSYSYLRNPGTPGGVADIFTYTLRDGDGDTVSASLTINIRDGGVNLTVPSGSGDGQVVAEAGLENGSDPESGSATTEGTLTFAAADGPARVFIGGVEILAVGQTIEGSNGTLTILAIGPGTIAYSYTLTSPASGDDAQEIFGVTVTDADGDAAHGNLVIDITDDMPVAVPDADLVIADGEGAFADGNVLTGAGGVDANASDGSADIEGADGAVVTAVTFDGTAGTLGAPLAGAYGTLTLQGDGSYRYELDEAHAAVIGLDSDDELTETFEYMITDADGDPATATLTIIIRGKDDGVVVTGLDADEAEAAVSEANLADGSAPDADALLREGSFDFTAPDGLASLTVGGVLLFDGAIVPDVTIITDHGVLTITGFVPLLDGDGEVIGGTISYSYELTDNLAHEGAEGDTLTESFAVGIVDSDGTVGSASLDIAIADDEPAAADDDASTGEGQTLEVDAASGVLANDVPGADMIELIGVRAAGGDLATPATTGIGTAIAGLYGTLILTADGGYSYVSDPNLVLPAGATDIFVYSVQDGDDDVATALLTITLADSGLTAETVALDVAEAALPDGSDPDSDGENAGGDLNDHVSGGTGPYSFALVGDGVGTNGFITINPDGSYLYTLTNPVAGALANNGMNIVPAVESFTYTATDAFGNVTSNSIIIDITDDVPVARADPPLAIAEDAATFSGELLENDTAGADGATLTSVTIGSVVIAIAASGTTNHSNALGTYSFDASGAWSFNPVPGSRPDTVDAGFSYTITDGDGDRATASQVINLLDGQNPQAGAPLTLTLDDQNLENGSSPTSDPLPTTSGTIAYTTGSDPIVSIAFGSLAGLGGGLTWVFDTPTSVIGYYTDIPIVQLDLTVTGTTATVVATLYTNYPFHPDIDIDDIVDLGSVEIVATDSDGDPAVGTVAVRISDDVPSIVALAVPAGLLTVDESDLAVDATANFANLFSMTMGADQPGTVTYSFTVIPVSGLVDIATGSSILLSAIGNVVEGYLASSPSTIAFRLTVGANGMATLDQMRAVRHAENPNPDDPVTLDAFRISLTATITDSEGDSASTTVNIGRALVFRDDGPSIDIVAVDTGGILLTTQDAETRGAAFDTASESFAAAFTAATVDYGEDGAPAAATIGWQYALQLGAGAPATGLFSNGVAITLALVGGEIVGSAGAVPVFTVSVDPASGLVTLTQYAEIDHPLPGASSDYASQLVTLPAGLIELKATATITDRDGDSIPDSATLDLGGNIRFADDGPSVTVSGSAGELTVDESVLATNATADLSGLFASTLDHGADGPGAIAYELGVIAGASGLIDSLSGEAVTLSIVGGIIFGRTSAHEVFRISVSANGIVTFDQSRAVMHSPDNGPDQEVRLSGANLITLTAVVTDGDGDSARATVDITDRFVIRDDAPVAATDEDNVARDGEVFADGNVLTGSGGLDTNGMDGAADAAGNDGGLTIIGIASGLVAGTIGAAFAGDYGTITLLANGSYRYDLDIADPAVVALNGTETLVEIFRYTVADADGDRSEAEIRITITGANDFPVAQADTNWVLDGASGSDPSAAGNVLLNIAHPGAPSGSFADAADTDPDLEVLTVTTTGTYPGLYGTLVIASDGVYSYTLNEDHPAVNALDSGQTLTEIFSYTVSDGALSVSSSLTITVFGTNDAPTVGTSTARISEEGVAGGNADTLPDATLDTTNAASFSGVLAIADVDAGETLTATLGDPGNILAVGGVPVTWSGIGTGLLIGSVGSNEVIRITLAPSGAYSVTLSRGIDHANLTLEDLHDFTVPVSVSDGTVTTSRADAIRIIIEDDSPIATGETGASTQPAQNVNTLFILDFSASIDTGELDIMLDAVKDALTLLDSAALGTVDIQFVIFSTSSFASPSFTSAAAANAYLDSLNPSEGGTRPDTIGETTNYTSAIQTALANFSVVPGASNQVFFLSDGNPNTQVQFAGFPPTVVNSLQNATAAAWNSFVDGNNISVTAIGVDNNPLEPLNIQRLADVDLNSAPDNVPILVADFDDLVATLLEIVVPVAVGGDLDANDSYGADGGRLLSITIGAVTYTWDGASTISLSGGGTIAGTSLNAIVTPMGGALTLNFATGQYSYQPPTPITVTATEIFSYTLVDGDGDRATAALSVTITAAAPPVVLDLDGDGVEFVSSAVGARFDYDGDGAAELTAWAGADDGLLVFDRNGDGKITEGGELVFAAGALTDLQGLAAKYDSNRDGQFDAADAEFASFGVWQDANSNGITDPGEYRTLAEAGIVRIGLVSDGKGYVTADGEVIVRGEAHYARADGSAGRLADAAFATNFANDVQRSLVANANVMSSALFAAGLVAALPLAAADAEKTTGFETRELDLAPYIEPPEYRAEPEAPDAASELWLGDFAIAPGLGEDSPEPALRHFAGAENDGAAPALDMQAEPVALRQALHAIEPDAPAIEPRFAFAGSTDQIIAAPMAPVSEGGPDLARLVSAALEGREIDLDALVEGDSAEVHAPIFDPLGFDPLGGASDLFVPDFQQAQLAVQFEQMASAGHS